MATYIVQIEVDEAQLKKVYKELGDPNQDVTAMVKNELHMGDYVTVIKIEKVDV